MTPEEIRALFAPALPVRVRRMFGGHGIYEGDLMFALEAGGILYLKTNTRTLPSFAAVGSEAFGFERAGRTVVTSYRRLPDEAFDDGEALRRWVVLALAAAAPVRRRASRSARPR